MHRMLEDVPYLSRTDAFFYASIMSKPLIPQGALSKLCLPYIIITINITNEPSSLSGLFYSLSLM